MTATPVLLVDDNALNLKLVDVLLRSAGYEVAIAASAQEALAVLARFTPKLILMDIQMPGMDGLTLTRKLRADGRFDEVVIVALTAHAMKDDEDRAFAAGCDGYIVKPIDTRTLAAKVADYLRRGVRGSIVNGAAHQPALDGPEPHGGAEAESEPVAGAAGRILIVEDNEVDSKLLEEALAAPNRRIDTCTDGREALAALDKRGADLVVSDIVMPNMDGLELLREIRRRSPALPVILVTRYGSIPAAVDAMRAGAFDYVVKPIDVFELKTQVTRALELDHLKSENTNLRRGITARFGPEAIAPESTHSRILMDLVRRVAPSRSTVLIQGESGTGKELVARLLHFWSDRVNQPFVAINCKAFAESVLESELFGHEKGAFTGAMAARQGCFERASGGTLFLDEIGDIGTEFQAKLLRVLQEGEVLRVGGSEPRRVDVRVIAATNRVLRDKVSDESFREDLYFRLNVIPIYIMPLRERRDDILPLAHHFLNRFAIQAGRRMTLGASAEKALLEHHWPGNVRELENTIERAVVLTRSDIIEKDDLHLEPGHYRGAANHTAAQSMRVAESASIIPSEAAPPPAPATTPPEGSQGATLTEYLDQAAADRIARALEQANGNRALAARNLGIGRATLYRFMRRMGEPASARRPSDPHNHQP